MIEITNGFTSISAGFDSVGGTAQLSSRACHIGAPRSPTGARVTVEFRRETALAPAQPVKVVYDFAGDGNLREGAGIAKLIRTVVRWGHVVQYCYRVSYWIAPSALMHFVPDEVPLLRADQPLGLAQPRPAREIAALQYAEGAAVIDPFRA